MEFKKSGRNKSAAVCTLLVHHIRHVALDVGDVVLHHQSAHMNCLKILT